MTSFKENRKENIRILNNSKPTKSREIKLVSIIHSEFNNNMSNFYKIFLNYNSFYQLHHIKLNLCDIFRNFYIGFLDNE